MLRSRWLRRAGPGIVALGAVAALASTTLGARDRPWDPPDVRRRARRDRPAAARSVVAPFEPRTDRRRGSGSTPSSMARVRSAASASSSGGAGGPSRRTLLLPPESFAAGPFGAVVLVGSDDGTTSRLVALDVLAGCASTLATFHRCHPARHDQPGWGVDRRVPGGSTDPVRSRDMAATAPWRRSAPNGSLRPSNQMPGSAGPGPRSSAGPTMGRSPWSRAARSRAGRRVLDAAWRPTATVSDPELGATIGVADGRLVSYLACRGLPCPIVATDLATGRRRTLVAQAGSAVLTSTTAGDRLVHAVDVGGGPTLRSLAIDGSHRVDLGPIPDGFDLLTGAESCRWPASPRRPAGPSWPRRAGCRAMGPRPTPTLRQVLDGRSATLGEVLP